MPGSGQKEITHILKVIVVVKVDLLLLAGPSLHGHLCQVLLRVVLAPVPLHRLKVPLADLVIAVGLVVCERLAARPAVQVLLLDLRLGILLHLLQELLHAQWGQVGQLPL